MPPLVRPALVFFIALSVLTGVLYPLAVTGLGQALFPDQANGSLLLREGRPVGSRLIGQSFSDPAHFWGRPSATGPMAYNASASSGSNQGPLNPALTEAVKARIAALREADPDQKAPVPVDLVTASASGLDPHISPATAAYQLPRVARARHLDPAQLQALIEQHTERPLVGVLGEARVNVLTLNLALDALH
ncbi:MAG: potassium-transporting ATPase subunit KdpC [Curvibacter lanceolatus]|jgi:K+-transporting ATPase ATPase C chain|uniref:potassium-transporting ATPase subunit KdpC n=1 Tax=Curvibacter lanceolatus TaxID=86182 RepID=UPI00037BDA35|nr:potassium-transporting ATPase subunit KdpC [Curvibacter lanceolatus]MBV5293892.1 potassium-transporting ATPase subunit KdpC [Curvibacter lanceolatus]